MRVAVVGGGLAGIAAALRCADAGADVTLFEVRPRLGGAAYSFRRDGLWLDNGQHVFLRCCEAYRALLRRPGSERRTTLQPRLDIPVLAPGGPVGRLRRGGLPAPLHLAGTLARYPHLTPLQRAGAVRAALALSRLDASDPALDARALGAWLAEHGQGPAAVAALWDLIARPTINVGADEAALGLAAFVFQTGLLRERAAGDVGWAAAPLSAIHDEPARAALSAAGVTVRLGARVERVVAAAPGRFEVHASDDGMEAGAVVVALPHGRAGAVLPEAAGVRAADLTALGASPIVNLHVAYDRPVTDLPLAAGVRTPVQFVFDRTASSGLGGDGQLLAVSLSAADAEMALSSARLRERYLPALAELLPRARGAKVEGFWITREHAATFRAAPGTARLRPGPRTALPGLVLAGAWTATGWPATMEGAVLSGEAAAREALGAPGAAERPLEVAA